ncbi:MAG: ATP synthase subunit C [Pseudomonadota bacterium]|nr:ATP synthase subunit C [Pseudomonadota bacterium]
MYGLLTLMTVSLLGMIMMGIYYEFHPLSKQNAAPRWLSGSIGINLLIFLAAQFGLLFLGIDEVMAQSSGATQEISIGQGLAIIGIGIPTAFAAIGAGIAVGPVGAASLAVIAEKPEMFGRTLVYLGLAEGIAIYGLVVTILLLGQLG